MIAHVSIHVSNYEKSKEFYTKALAPLGYEVVMDMPQHKVIGMGVKGNPDFWVVERKGNLGGPASSSLCGEHVAIMVGDKSAVDSFHKAALEAGGKDNGAPGIREEYSSDYYAAFVFDLDGNNIEAVTFK